MAAMIQGFTAGQNCCINDIKPETNEFSSDEKISRCKLATLFRLVDYFGWTQTIYNHISVRMNDYRDQYLVNPFGLLYNEVSAAKLLKVNTKGDVLGSGSTSLGFNAAGFVLHSAIHEARPDVNCVIHLHTADVVAVSTMRCGLLPISQEALIVGDVSYHPYEGILIDEKEMKHIQENLGPSNMVMILENHGVVACGSTVEEAFDYLYLVMAACKTQVRALSAMSEEKLILLDREKLKSRTEDVAKVDLTQGIEQCVKWGIGEMQFEALARNFDRMGLSTGYPYRKPELVQMS